MSDADAPFIGTDEVVTATLEGQANRDVQANVVRMSQSVAEHVEGEAVRMEQSIVQAVHAISADVRQSGVVTIDADNASARGSIVLAARSGTLSAQRSGVGFVTTQDAYIEDAQAGAVIGQHVEAKNTRTLVLIGRHIEGDVQTVLDTRGAVFLGLSTASVVGLISILMGLLFRRPRQRYIQSHRDASATKRLRSRTAWNKLN